FGRAKLGVGTEDTYKGKLNYNRFNKNTQLSVIANANNINEIPFSWKEFREFAPSNDWNSDLIRGIGDDEGINQTVSLGVNLNHEFSKKFELQGFYYLTQNNNELDKEVSTRNFNDDTLYLKTLQNIEKEESKLNHSFNIKMEWKPDSMTEIGLWSNVFIAGEEYDNISSTLYDPTVELTNFTENRSNSDIDKLSSYNSINYKRKFNKKRRNIRLFANHFSINQDNKTSIDNQVFGQDIKQNQLYDNQLSKPRFGASYTEPLDSFWVLTTAYNFKGENEKPNRDFFDIDNNQQETLNDSLSSAFKRVSNENSGSITFRRNKNKKNFSIGTSANNIDLTVNNNTQNFQYMLPFASLRFRLKGSQNLNIRYYTRTRIPSLQQLVTIPDNLNPNSVYVGNAKLRPEYSHNINFNYFNFDPASSTHSYAGFSMSSTSNKIVNQTIINEDFTTRRTPQNSGFSQNLNMYAGINRPIKKLKIKLVIYPSVNWSRYDVFLNTVESEVLSATYRTRFKIDRLKKEKWSLSVGFDFTYNDRQYEASSSFNQTIGSYGAFVRGDVEITKSLQFKWDYALKAFNATTFAEARELHLVDLSIRQSFNEDAWAISLVANDLLNENVGIQRNGDVNTLFSSSYNTRAQYFMLVFEKSLGKKVTNPNKKKGGHTYYFD
ncbi:MAG: outer membrane beta-barrel protein, partial [Flavobacteriales bacterium]|nr:outer membrane beta-barrel protein [Flavobacteriales bacterium]